MILTCDINGVEFDPIEIISHDVNDQVLWHLRKTGEQVKQKLK